MYPRKKQELEEWESEDEQDSQEEGEEPEGDPENPGEGKEYEDGRAKIDAPCHFLYFTETGCTRGQRCRFRHDMTQDQADSRAALLTPTWQNTPSNYNGDKGNPEESEWLD